MPWAPDYATLAEAKDYERIGDAADDLTIAMWVTAASRAVDRATGRQFGSATATFVYSARACYFDAVRDLWVVDVDDHMSAVGLAVVADGESATPAAHEERNAVAKGRPWTRLVFAADAWMYVPVEISVELDVWGWTAVPAAAKGATLLQVSRWAARRDSPFGVAGSPEQGNELRLLERLDPDVAVMLRDLERKTAPR